jgi:uracil-DNA glycosylase
MLSWSEALAEEKQADYFRQLLARVKNERQAGDVIYPPAPQVFEAFRRTELGQIRAVILGQDPYHGPGQAHGLCFSVQHGVRPPPSLQNIFKELQQDVGFRPPGHGCLDAWADQGVLLLNTTLTVRAGDPQSHSRYGWQRFTDRVIEIISERLEGVVFLLWGRSAINKQRLIDGQRHHLLTAPHPSPLSAHRGFLGCGHFSTCNRLLDQQQRPVIDWQLPSQP